MLRSVITAVIIGVLGGLWFALLNDSIEVFQNYVEGAWRYEFAARSLAAPVVGMVIGALAGANIYLALAPSRVDGFARGALAGAGAAFLLILAQLAFVAIAANFGDYRLSYQHLLARLCGILFVAAVLGAVFGALSYNRPPIGLLPGAIAGALIGASFALPAVVATTFLISALSDAGYPPSSFILIYVLPNAVSPLAGAACGAVVGAARRTTFTAVVIATTTAVTASSVTFLYIIGLAFLHISFTPAVYAIRISVGIIAGIAVGFFIIADAPPRQLPLHLAMRE